MVTRTPMALEIDCRALTNRVGRGHVCKHHQSQVDQQGPRPYNGAKGQGEGASELSIGLLE